MLQSSAPACLRRARGTASGNHAAKDGSRRSACYRGGRSSDHETGTGVYLTSSDSVRSITGKETGGNVVVPRLGDVSGEESGDGGPRARSGVVGDDVIDLVAVSLRRSKGLARERRLERYPGSGGRDRKEW